MHAKKIFLFIIVFFLHFNGYSQGNFRILHGKKSSSIPFKLINNLMIIDVEMNGKKLSFLFDTGIDKTILFNLKISDSVILNNPERFKVYGLGEGKPIEAIKSKNNILRIKDVLSPNQMIYVLLDEQFNLSTKMGIDINGIIGGNLFKDFVVKINYSSKKITFFNPKSYVYPKCNTCLTLPLEFYKRKPLIDVEIENNKKERIKVRLLIDSGSGDAVWLFENSHPNIQITGNNFNDYLGNGLGGNIYGKRSLLNNLIIGQFQFDNVVVAYPDSTSIRAVYDNKERNGTLGADILRRFHVIFDYPNRKITLKKNKSKFNSPFYYNKSGIEIIYGGEMLVKEKRSKFRAFDEKEGNNNSIYQVIYSYGLAYKPSYQIALVRDNSPAKNAGLIVGDILLEINGKIAYDYNLQEIIKTLSGKANKKIRILIDRDGKQLKYEFILKDLL